MASSTRACAINKCEISSCAVCHCCQNDLCLDHLKEHKDQLNAKLTPLANQINTCLDALEHFTPTSLPSFQILEQWRVVAHQTVDRFYERMRQELFEQRKNKPLEKLYTVRTSLEQLIRKQGATQENIKALTNDIRSIEQEMSSLQNIQINLRPLVIDDNIINQVNSSNTPQQNTGANRGDYQALVDGSAFQIFVQLLTGKKIILAVKSSDTILAFKRQIEKKEGVPIEQQHLTYMGKQLKNDYLASMYDIQRHCTLNLVMLLKQ